MAMTRRPKPASNKCIGIRPNEGTLDLSLALWLPEGRVAFTKATREQKQMCESPLEVGGVPTV